MPSREFYFDQIEKECASAREAVNTGNDGKVRVCARRVVSHAVTWFLTKNPEKQWRPDAIGQLQSLAQDTFFPQDIRDAAVRLSMRVTEQFKYSSPTDPLADAQRIITYIEQLVGS